VRGLLMKMRYGRLNQWEIGEMLGLDYGSVSVSRKRYRVMKEGIGSICGLPKELNQKLFKSERPVAQITFVIMGPIL
jgi:hypothetical protein